MECMYVCMYVCMHACRQDVLCCYRYLKPPPARLLANPSYPMQASGMEPASEYCKTPASICCEAEVYWNASATKRCVAIAYFSYVRMVFDWAGFSYRVSCSTAVSLSSSSEQKGTPGIVRFLDEHVLISATNV